MFILKCKQTKFYKEDNSILLGSRCASSLVIKILSQIHYIYCTLIPGDHTGATGWESNSSLANIER